MLLNILGILIIIIGTGLAIFLPNYYNYIIFAFFISLGYSIIAFNFKREKKNYGNK